MWYFGLIEFLEFYSNIRSFDLWLSFYFTSSFSPLKMARTCVELKNLNVWFFAPPLPFLFFLKSYNPICNRYLYLFWKKYRQKIYYSFVPSFRPFPLPLLFSFLFLLLFFIFFFSKIIYVRFLFQFLIFPFLKMIYRF